MAVQTSGGFGPQARSSPLQVVKPHPPDVGSDGVTVGDTVGAAARCPGEVHPVATSVSTKIQIANGASNVFIIHSPFPDTTEFP